MENKPTGNEFMITIRFEEGQGSAGVTSHPLAQGVIPTLLMIGLSSIFTRNTPAAFSALPTVPDHDQKSPAQPSPVPPDQAACSCWRESLRRPGCSHRLLGHEQSPRGRVRRQSSGEPHPFSVSAPSADPTADVWLQSGRSPAHVHGGRAVRDISPL